jgi:hypothetical protein
MKTLGLLEVAARAEALRLRCQAVGMVRSAIFLAVAAVFGLAALALLHVAAIIWLAPQVGPLEATLYLAGADVLLALILMLMARKEPYRRAAQEALELRQDTMRMVRNVSPTNEVANLIPWRGLMMGLGTKMGTGLVRRLIFGRRRR